MFANAGPAPTPARSHDINLLDVCLRGHLKQLVYATCLHQECLKYKLIVLSYPADRNPKDRGRANVQFMKLVSISEHVCMNFLFRPQSF